MKMIEEIKKYLRGGILMLLTVILLGIPFSIIGAMFNAVSLENVSLSQIGAMGIIALVMSIIIFILKVIAVGYVGYQIFKR